MNPFDKKHRAIPPSSEYKEKHLLKCFNYFDIYQDCRRSNLTNFYEIGQIRPCLEEWENFRWCFKAKYLKNRESLERLKVRNKNIYLNLDKMPWIWRNEYLIYLKNQERLPKRYYYLINDDNENEN
ncbi:hypothetical protein ABK040_006443 [Willaertia magna]